MLREHTMGNKMNLLSPTKNRRDNKSPVSCKDACKDESTSHTEATSRNSSSNSGEGSFGDSLITAASDPWLKQLSTSSEKAANPRDRSPSALKVASIDLSHGSTDEAVRRFNNQKLRNPSLTPAPSARIHALRANFENKHGEEEQRHFNKLDSSGRSVASAVSITSFASMRDYTRNKAAKEKGVTPGGLNSSSSQLHSSVSTIGTLPESKRSKSPGIGRPQSKSPRSPTKRRTQSPSKAKENVHSLDASGYSVGASSVSSQRGTTSPSQKRSKSPRTKKSGASPIRQQSKSPRTRKSDPSPIRQRSKSPRTKKVNATSVRPKSPKSTLASVKVSRTEEIRQSVKGSESSVKNSNVTNIEAGRRKSASAAATRRTSVTRQRQSSPSKVRTVRPADGKPLDSSGYSVKSVNDSGISRDSPFSRLDPPSALKENIHRISDTKVRSTSRPKAGRTAASPRKLRDESPGKQSVCALGSGGKGRSIGDRKPLEESGHSVGTSASRKTLLDSPRKKSKELDGSSHSVTRRKFKSSETLDSSAHSVGNSAPKSPRTSSIANNRTSRVLDGSSHSRGNAPLEANVAQGGGVARQRKKASSAAPADHGVSPPDASTNRIGSKPSKKQSPLHSSQDDAGKLLDASLRSLGTAVSVSSKSTTSTLETPLTKLGASKSPNSEELRLKVGASDNVLTVNASRRQPTMHLPAPHLYVGVGTESGVVVVSKLNASAGLTGISYSGISDRVKSKRLGKSIFARRGGSVRSIDFSPDGRYMAVGGDDGCCCVYSLEYSGAKEKDKLSGVNICVELTRSGRVYSVQFSPDGKYLAIGGFDALVAIVEVSSLDSGNPEVLREIPSEGKVFSLDWCSTGCYLAFGGSDKCCSIVDTKVWRIVKEFKRPASVQAVKWSPHGGASLAVGTTDVAIVDRESLTIKTEIDLRNVGTASPSTYLARIMVNTLCWSPNGYMLVVGTSNNKCSFVDMKNFETVKEIPRSSEITSVCWGEQAVLGDAPRRYMAVFPRRFPADAVRDEEVRSFDLRRITADDRT